MIKLSIVSFFLVQWRVFLSLGDCPSSSVTFFVDFAAVSPTWSMQRVLVCLIHTNNIHKKITRNIMKSQKGMIFLPKEKIEPPPIIFHFATTTSPVVVPTVFDFHLSSSCRNWPTVTSSTVLLAKIMVGFHPPLLALKLELPPFNLGFLPCTNATPMVRLCSSNAIHRRSSSLQP